MNVFVRGQLFAPLKKELRYLSCISILDTEINALMKLALDSIAFLPFGYQMNRWRWGVFQGKITPSQYNAEWWKLTNRYQGIESPIKLRENDFDPGLKYLMADDKKYVR